MDQSTMNDKEHNRNVQFQRNQLANDDDQLPPAQEVSRLTALLVGGGFFFTAGLLIAVEAIWH